MGVEKRRQESSRGIKAIESPGLGGRLGALTSSFKIELSHPSSKSHFPIPVILRVVI